MRLNKYISQHTNLSRRKADAEIMNRRVYINDRIALVGDNVGENDIVYLNGKRIIPVLSKRILLLLNKPVGYVCSKDGQGSKTIYDMIPSKYHSLNPVGRLDKDSSGLLLMTNDGDLLNKLSHPSNNSSKVYRIKLINELGDSEIEQFLKGVDIGDRRKSKFKSIKKIDFKVYEVVLEEGRNRQIRRTLEALNNEVVELIRIRHGEYSLDNIKEGNYSIV